MLRYVAYCLLILFSYCSDSVKTGSSKLTEEQKRKYFVDSFALAYGFGYYETDSARSFQTFFKKHYPEIKAVNTHDAFPYALEEEYIDTTKIESGRQWFRVTVTRPFQRPFVIKTDSKYGRPHITAKFTNGDGGYVTGTLAATITSPVKDSIIKLLFESLDKYDFWGQPSHFKEGLFLHPEVWVIEAINKGRYHYMVRQSGDLKNSEFHMEILRQVSDLKNILKIEELLDVWRAQ